MSYWKTTFLNSIFPLTFSFSSFFVNDDLLNIYKTILFTDADKYAPEIGSTLGIYSGYDISIIPLWLALAALGFSILIGIISGLYPARKATKIRAIEAMRTSA